MEYKSVIIIGNGFDLNLGLKTGYGDFIKSSLFNDLLESGNALCKYLKDKQTLCNWIDIENELKAYSKNIYEGNDRKPFRLEYQELCRVLCEYLNKLDLSEIDKTSKVYSLFPTNFDNTLIINFNYTDSVEYIS